VAVSGTVKAIAIGLACLLLVICVVIYFLVRQSAQYLEVGGNAMVAGAEFGRGTDHDGCLGKALSHYKRDSSFGGTLNAKAFLGGCLETSRSTEGFCHGVPRSERILQSARWRVEHCNQAGLEGQGCSNLFGQLEEFCHAGAVHSHGAPIDTSRVPLCSSHSASIIASSKSSRPNRWSYLREAHERSAPCQTKDRVSFR
jgi:hypothetical protein